MTMGTIWSYRPNDEYKSAEYLLQTLVDVVAKGGNFLLNIGPRADGTLPAKAVENMEIIGKWLQLHGEAIYNTVPLYPYTFNVTIDKEVVQLRLTRRDNVVYVHFWPSARAMPLFLPFVVNVPGGLDGTWPNNNVRSVQMLGKGVLNTRFDPVRGLWVNIIHGSPYIGVLKIEY